MIDPNTHIDTFDATNLYSNSPNELAKQAILYWIYYTQTHSTQDLTKVLFIVSMEIILNNNSFQFNNINYIQTRGTAMGIKRAPNYATLTQEYYEENLHEIK